MSWWVFIIPMKYYFFFYCLFFFRMWLIMLPNNLNNFFNVETRLNSILIKKVPLSVFCFKLLSLLLNIFLKLISWEFEVICVSNNTGRRKLRKRRFQRWFHYNFIIIFFCCLLLTCLLICCYGSLLGEISL